MNCARPTWGGLHKEGNQNKVRELYKSTFGCNQTAIPTAVPFGIEWRIKTRDSLTKESLEQHQYVILDNGRFVGIELEVDHLIGWKGIIVNDEQSINECRFFQQFGRHVFDLFGFVEFVIFCDVLTAVLVAVMRVATAGIGIGGHILHGGGVTATGLCTHAGPMLHLCFTIMFVKREPGRAEKDRDSEDDM